MSDNELSSFGDWALKGKLGAGGYGEVLLWKHRRTNQNIATKRCVRDRNAMHDDEVHKLKERWLLEYKWMRHNVGTEFIVRGIELPDASFVAYLNAQHGAWRPLPVIVMEYCNGGDLRQQLKRPSNCNGLSEFEVRAVMLALRHAVEYLHKECKIEHRDLKPDNIVVHETGGNKIYKLTDFGFGCQVLNQTTQASIVGTNNYIAPEIVLTSQYTKTVDYWSMGVIAFELMCGVLPFIPHQTLLTKVNQLREKPAECIAITENFAHPNTFQLHTQLFHENHMSSVFQEKMENWLRLALDFNFRTRGCLVDSPHLTSNSHTSSQNLQIFTALEGVLVARVLTVFCLNTFQFYSYDLSSNANMQDIMEALEHDTHLSRSTYFFILPTGHPYSKITKHTQSLDLYVDAWINTAPDSGNPPVMLYLLSFQQDYKAPSPKISPLIQHSLQLASNAELPAWAQQQLAVQTHFLVANEQRHLEAFLCGLHEYAMTLEHEMFLSESVVTNMGEQILVVGGSVRQFNTMVQQAKLACQERYGICSSFFNRWDLKMKSLNAKMNALQTEVRQSVKKRYNSAYRRIKELAKSNFYKEKINADLYQLSALRNKIKDLDIYNSLKFCRDAVYVCLEQRNKFLTGLQLKEIQAELAEVHLEYRKILDIVADAQAYVQILESDLVQASAEFQQQMIDSCTSSANAKLDLDLCQEMNGINIIDGSRFSQPNSGVEAALSLDDILNLPSTSQLVEDTKEQINLIEMVYSEGCSDLPATINMQ